MALALDPAEEALWPLSQAAALAAKLELEHFSLVMIMPPSPWPPSIFAKHHLESTDFFREKREFWQEQLRVAFEGIACQVRIFWEQAKVEERLLQRACQERWDLLVFVKKESSQGSGALIKHYAEQGPSDILVIGADNSFPFTRPAVATDFSPHAERALRRSLALSAGLYSKIIGIHLYHAWGGFMHNSESRRELLKDLKEYAAAEWSKLAAQYPEYLVPEIVAVEKQERDDYQLLKLCKKHKIDLLVLGSKGHTASERIFLGSFTTKVLSSISEECALLIVKEAGENHTWLQRFFTA